MRGVSLSDGSAPNHVLAVGAHPDDIEAALKAYEEALFPRSKSAAAEAHRNHGFFFDDRAPKGLIDFFTGALEEKRE